MSLLRVLLAAGLLAGMPWLLGSVTLATEAATFALAVLGSTLIFGYCGLLSFGQALFFGVGSYVAALLLKGGHASLVTAALAATAAAAAIGLAVGATSIRRSGIYFVMLTLAFGNLGFFFAYTASDITGGENGLLDVTRSSGPLLALGIDLSNGLVFYALCALTTFLAYLGMVAIQRSAFGSVLRAIRQNEQRATVLGYDARLYKITAFTLAAALAGLGGALNVGLMQFVSLNNASIGTSERILVMTLLSGGKSFLGALLATGLFTGLSDLLAALWPRWMLLLGLVIIALAFGLDRPGLFRLPAWARPKGSAA